MPDARTRFRRPSGGQVRKHIIPRATQLRAGNIETPQGITRRPHRGHTRLVHLVAIAVVLGLFLGRAGVAIGQAPPEPAAAMTAFNAVRGWVDATLVPAEAEVAGLGLPDAPASVTIRYAGRVVGRGTSFLPGPGSALRDAASRAIREASDRVELPVDPELRREVVRSLVISLELASKPTPIAPDALRDFSVSMSPGIHGVAARLGDRIEAVFPGTMLATGLEASAALGAVASAVTGSAENALRDPVRVRRDLGVSFSVFRTTHIAETGAGSTPLFLYRGSRLPRSSPPTLDDLASLADSIAMNLLERSQGVAGHTGIAGTYLPIQDRFDPTIATAIEQGLVAVALARYATSPRTDPEIAEAALELAQRLVEDLAIVVPEEVAPDASPMSAAMASIAIRTALKGGAPMSEAVATMLGRCDASMDEASLERLSAPERAFVAWGLAVRAASTGDPVQKELAIAAVRGAFLATPIQALVGQMPWLAWADMALSSEGEPVAGAEALRQMRALVWAHQVQIEDAGEDGADMVGGILFTGSSSPLPTAQTLRALAANTSMMADPRLTEPGELPRELSKTLAGIRFLDALVANEGTCHMFAAPFRARGGVRAGLWDQRMPPESGALALLVLSDTLRVVAPAVPAAPTDGARAAETPKNH